MGKAKNIILKPITSQEANAIIKKLHYSGKVVNNSRIHIGVFYNGSLEGAMQFGSPLDKSKVIGLVEDTKWNDFVELNRMAFSDNLPRNSESRALSIAFKLLRKHAPHLKWVLSFSDACQCGDGTIYRASGFILTGINSKSDMIWRLPDKLRHLSRGGDTVHRITVQTKTSAISHWVTNTYGNPNTPLKKLQQDHGGELLSGCQMRYIYFLDPTYREKLTVPMIPFDEIKKRGFSMYKGEKIVYN